MKSIFSWWSQDLDSLPGQSSRDFLQVTEQRVYCNVFIFSFTLNLYVKLWALQTS